MTTTANATTKKKTKNMPDEVRDEERGTIVVVRSVPSAEIEVEKVR